jgi:anti-sigma B factor antagonist
MARLEGAAGEGPAELAIDSHIGEDEVAVVTVSGELDISNAKALEDALGAVTARQPKRLVFHLGDLRYIDSAGIAVLLAAAGRSRGVGLRDPSAAVRRVVELTGLTEILPIES